MEDLRFSSSLYMTLIWLRIFWWVSDFLESVKKKMNPQLEGFSNFFKDPNADNYLEWIFKEIEKPSSQAGSSKPNIQRRLAAGILDSHDDDEEMALPAIPSRFLPNSDKEEILTKSKMKNAKKK